MSTLLMRLRQLPQLVQFGLVGGSAAATHLLVVAIVVALTGLPPLWANVLGFLVAFIVSYNGHAALTFHRRRHAAGPRWPAFAVACGSFVANELLYAAALLAALELPGQSCAGTGAGGCRHFCSEQVLGLQGGSLMP